MASATVPLVGPTMTAVSRFARALAAIMDSALMGLVTATLGSRERTAKSRSVHQCAHSTAHARMGFAVAAKDGLVRTALFVHAQMSALVMAPAEATSANVIPGLMGKIAQLWPALATALITALASMEHAIALSSTVAPIAL